MPLIPNHIGGRQTWPVDGDKIDGCQAGCQLGPRTGVEDWLRRFSNDDGQTAGMGTGGGRLGSVGGQQRVKWSGCDRDFNPLTPPLLNAFGELLAANDFGSSVHLLTHL